MAAFIQRAILDIKTALEITLLRSSSINWYSFLTAISTRYPTGKEYP